VPQPELVVLLAEDGAAIGAADKTTVHSGRTPLHLAFSCYAFDTADRLLVTRRSPAKRTFPGVWTNTCCGHPAPGEPVADAVSRRMAHELALVPHALQLVLPEFRYRASMAGIEENELCPVYLCRVDRDPRPRSDEVADYRWLHWPDYVHAITAGVDVSPWSLAQVHALERGRLVDRFLTETS
jgi:isopentenyl-diphosphate delta-isomerase